MAKELRPKGIRVNALCLGMITTKFRDDFTKDDVRTIVALNFSKRADELADLVL